MKILIVDYVSIWMVKSSFIDSVTITNLPSILKIKEFKSRTLFLKVPFYESETREYTGLSPDRLFCPVWLNHSRDPILTFYPETGTLRRERKTRKSCSPRIVSTAALVSHGNYSQVPFYYLLFYIFDTTMYLVTVLVLSYNLSQPCTPTLPYL